LKEAWHCEPQPEIVYAIYPGTPKEMPLYQCPLRYCTREVREALFLHGHYKAGTLGAVCDRLPLPATAIAAFLVLDKIFSELVPTDA